MPDPMPSKRRPVATANARPKRNRGRNEPPVCIIVSSLSAEGQIAIARSLLDSLPSGLSGTVLLASDLETGRRAAPEGVDVHEYTTATPQPPSDCGDVVVMSHGLARPSRIAQTMAGGGDQARLVAVIDSRTFLDDIEKAGEFAAAFVATAANDAGPVSTAH